MEAELKRLHSPDALDLPNWTPGSEDFAILIQVMAAPEGTPGEEARTHVLDKRLQDAHGVRAWQSWERAMIDVTSNLESFIAGRVG
jgi:hypothetical protein